MKSSRVSRSDNNMWLIGPTAEVITGRRLPTNKQDGAFMLLLSPYFRRKKTIHESAICAVNKVISFWQKAEIPTKPVQHTIKKLEKYINCFKLLKKIKKRTTKKNAIEFAFTTLRNEKQPHNDYRKFLELVLIFLGETPKGTSELRVPSTRHGGWQKLFTV